MSGTLPQHRRDNNRLRNGSFGGIQYLRNSIAWGSCPALEVRLLAPPLPFPSALSKLDSDCFNDRRMHLPAREYTLHASASRNSYLFRILGFSVDRNTTRSPEGIPVREIEVRGC